MNADPKRLLASSNELGRLLQAANASYSAPANETEAWQRLRAQHSKGIERQRRRLAYVLVPLAAAALAALFMRARNDDRPWTLAADPAAVAVQSAAPPEVLESAASVPLQPASSPTTVAGPARSLDCTQLHKLGSPRDVASCLERLAAGKSIEAQRATLELAKLKREQLRDPAAAIQLLRGYRQRFPDGALKGEVDFVLLELLSQTGQAAQALAESDALLNTAWGRSRTSELRLMRGRLAQDKLSDCNRAVEELSYVKDEFGAIGDEAALRIAECLDRTGKRDPAIAAYRAYLTRGGAARADHARKRLDELENAH